MVLSASQRIADKPRTYQISYNVLQITIFLLLLSAISLTLLKNDTHLTEVNRAGCGFLQGFVGTGL